MRVTDKEERFERLAEALNASGSMPLEKAAKITGFSASHFHNWLVVEFLATRPWAAYDRKAKKLCIKEEAECQAIPK